ncbi:MAG TPA: polymorphic toxin-type HINT domain-containing protein, partial [Acidimicrobiia bacterium]
LWVQAKGWTKAQDLTPGDRLLKADGTTVTVTQTGPGPANATIYNLAVNHNHNYYATPQTLLTHNCPVGPGWADNIPNGAALSVDDALDAAADFLGRGYTEPELGRFLSADGTRQVRMLDADILDPHPHFNFEDLAPRFGRPERNQVVTNRHIYLLE